MLKVKSKYVHHTSNETTQELIFKMAIQLGQNTILNR
jgi:hypothetical protein